MTHQWWLSKKITSECAQQTPHTSTDAKAHQAFRCKKRGAHKMFDTTEEFGDRVAHQDWLGFGVRNDGAVVLAAMTECSYWTQTKK